MKKWLLLFIITATALTAYFYQDLRELQALNQYSNAFKADSIDQNFRSFHQQYPSISIPRSGPVYTFARSDNRAQLPQKFNYDGETREIQDWLTRSHTTGMAIYKDGKLVYENYHRGNDENSQAIIMSVSKSMTSMLVGVALEEGKINSINDPVVKYVPALIGSGYDHGVTIKHVLQMSSGVRWNEDYASLDSDLVRSVVATLLGSLDEFSASIPNEKPPGSYNRYASIDTQVLGMVLRGATGVSYQEYFEKKLWSKLGAEQDAKILIDAAGEPVVYGGVNITLRDMLRFGKLYLEQGVNHLGEQLVNPAWIKASTIAQDEHVQPGINNPNSDSGFGYGYQWWLPLQPDDDYSAIGIYGQFIYISPKHNIVIAKTSAYPNYTIDGGYMNHESLLAFQAIARQLSSQSF